MKNNSLGKVKAPKCQVESNWTYVNSIIKVTSANMSQTARISMQTTSVNKLLFISSENVSHMDSMVRLFVEDNREYNSTFYIRWGSI